jgi:hypothetical protein
MVYDECSNQREGDGDPTNDSIRDFFPFFLFWFVMRAGAGAGEVTSGVEE